MSIVIKKPGILTTVQDLGRLGYRSFGINPGGVMDRVTVRAANIILGNDEKAPMLEMHFPAAEIEFTDDTVFAICGADFSPTLNGEPIATWMVTASKRGGTLRFGGRRSGQRAYFAVKGGFTIEPWLGSYSTNLVASVGGFSGRQLAGSDRLECRSSPPDGAFAVGPSLRHAASQSMMVRITRGPEFDLLTAISERKLLTERFRLTNDCSRMGYRLSGMPLGLLNEAEMVSAGVNFGTIQLPPDGQMIVLMADHQTSGGYPRIANVISADLPILAQSGPGDSVAFRLVSVEEAEEAAMRIESELNFLRVGCRLLTR